MPFFFWHIWTRKLLIMFETVIFKWKPLSYYSQAYKNGLGLWFLHTDSREVECSATGKYIHLKKKKKEKGKKKPCPDAWWRAVAAENPTRFCLMNRWRRRVTPPPPQACGRGYSRKRVGKQHIFAWLPHGIQTFFLHDGRRLEGKPCIIGQGECQADYLILNTEPSL